MSTDERTLARGAARAAAPAAWWRTRGWGIVGALSITETVSWGILYYAFAVFLIPMQRELGFSTAELTGAYSLALLVSAVAGIAVGRWLDRRSPRGLMTAGSIAGTALVLAWSQVDGLAAFYALWIAIGVVMAIVLYEPAFTVLAKWFPDADQRRRAMTALTLVAALASFIFLPLSQALIDAHGWRDALVILALVLGAITIPLHALVLRPPPRRERVTARRDVQPSVAARDALRSVPFWLLSSAFFLGTFTGIAMTVHAIPFLLERGYSAPFAAFAVGLIGFSQIPGRVVFALIGSRLPRELAVSAVFVLIAAGIAVLDGRRRHGGRARRARAARHGQRHGHARPRHGHRRPLRRRVLRHDQQRRGRRHDRRASRRPGRRRRLRRRDGIRRAAVDARGRRRRGRAPGVPGRTAGRCVPRAEGPRFQDMTTELNSTQARGGDLRLPVAAPHARRIDAAEVWEDFHASLLAFIARRVRDRDSAEDILQEVMLRIHRHAREGEHPHALGAWVHQIARNAIADHYRRAANRREQPPASSSTDEPSARGTGRRRGSEATSPHVCDPSSTNCPPAQRGPHPHRARRPQPGRRGQADWRLDVGHEVTSATRSSPAPRAACRMLRDQPRPSRADYELSAAPRRVRVPELDVEIVGDHGP